MGAEKGAARDARRRAKATTTVLRAAATAAAAAAVAQVAMLASEPITDSITDWVPVPYNHTVILSKGKGGVVDVVVRCPPRRRPAALPAGKAVDGECALHAAAARAAVWAW